MMIDPSKRMAAVEEASSEYPGDAEVEDIDSKSWEAAAQRALDAEPSERWQESSQRASTGTLPGAEQIDAATPLQDILASLDFS